MFIINDLLCCIHAGTAGIVLVASVSDCVQCMYVCVSVYLSILTKIEKLLIRN